MYKKLVMIVLFLLIFSGCSKTLVDKDKKPVKYEASLICENCEKICNKNEQKEKCIEDCENKCQLAKKNETGQSLTENILCKPTNPDVLEIYKNNEVNLDNLVECKDFELKNSKYEGLWDSLFVKPLAWLILNSVI